MNFFSTIQKRNSFKLTSFAANDKGLIPVPVIVMLTIVALCGAGTIGFLLGKGYSFSMGIAIGIGLVIILPNLDRIIKWFKSVKGEIKK